MKAPVAAATIVEPQTCGNRSVPQHSLTIVAKAYVASLPHVDRKRNTSRVSYGVRQRSYACTHYDKAECQGRKMSAGGQAKETSYVRTVTL